MSGGEEEVEEALLSMQVRREARKTKTSTKREGKTGMQRCASSSHMNVSTLLLPAFIQKDTVLWVMTFAGQWLASRGNS